MTEQPVETEQQFLGNVPSVFEFGALPPAPLQHYSPNAHRIPVQYDKAEEAGTTNLPLEAEVHAGHAVRSLENGELDAGIAWLQSALAFAQNARHSREFGILEAGAL
jgi:hypothetical protein